MTRPLIMVCGLARCGSSLVMQMLAAAGLRLPGRHPSYESEGWTIGEHTLDLSQYDAVKWLDAHVPSDLPMMPPFAAVFMLRDHRQQARSHCKFMGWAKGIGSNRRDVRAIESSFARDEKRMVRRVAPMADATMTAFFEDVVTSPIPFAERLNSLAGGGLDVDAMASVVVKREPGCLEYMLEDVIGWKR